RKGSANTARGVIRFVDELVANLKRAGATGPMTVRADSGFWSWKLCDRLDAHKIGWSITVRLVPKVKAAIAAIDETAWQEIDYTIGGRAQVAETVYTAGRGSKQRSVRLIVRRTRLTEAAQPKLWPDWRHHAFICSNHDISMTAADAFHREHAVVELAIRDLKEGAGLDHIPSGHYHANAAWLACAVLAHNLGTWTSLLAGQPPVTNRTRRTRLIALPAVIANRSRQMLIRLPARWPWADQFNTALRALRALPAPSG
ncbi:MAG: transposase, partial [bacterium]|nr:transposase [bacterium]